MEQWPWIGQREHVLDTHSHYVRKDMSEGETHQREQSRAGVWIQRRPWNWAFTAIPQPALLRYDTHSAPPHTLWQRRKMTYLLLHFSLTPPPLATQTRWKKKRKKKRESTSIWPFPGTPLKDKTTTIRLHFSASCPPHSSGYVHSNPYFKTPPHLYSYSIILSRAKESAWYVNKSQLSHSSGSCSGKKNKKRGPKDCRSIAGRGQSET